MKSQNKAFAVKQKLNFLHSPGWIAVAFVLPLLLMMHFALAETADPGIAKFDHSKTGFSLTGSHIQAQCASCHVSGVFKGTPRDCASCHVAGNRMGAEAKTTKHIPTVAQCDKCHQTTAWTPATFSHVGLAPGSCLTCHNGTAAPGKPSGHIPTADSCDSCHKTIGWKQLTAGGTMPANHLPTTQACSLCHNQGSFIPGTMNHAGIINGCVNCHNSQSFAGVTPVPKPITHLPTSMPCEACHSSSNFTSFSGTLMKHTGIVNGCVNCHNGQTFAVGITPVFKPATHLATSSPCESCHTSTATFLLAAGAAMPAGHLPTAQVCSTCHSAASFVPGVMSHTGIVNNCTQCHNGQVFTGITPVFKPVNHLPTSSACEICHSSTISFTGTVMKHTGIIGGCTNCHNGQSFAGITPVSKPGTHLPTSMSCETCHSSSNFISFSGTQMNHSGIVSGCMNCHNGQTFAVGITPVFKPPTHLATSSPCETCHTSTASFLVAKTTMPANHLPTTQPCSFCHSGTSFYPGVMNHTGNTSPCTTCHNGQAFAGVTPVSKPVNHLPTSAACETCHSSSVFTTFAGTLMKHTGIVGGCTNCHNGQSFAGITPVSKPGNHLPTSMSCETCHSSSNFISFSGTLMNHAGIVSGCVNCHNGQTFAVGMTPVSKPSTHLATSSPCESCHTSTVSFLGATGGTMPANHLPTTQPCSTCHSSTNFVPGVMNHAGIVGGCTTCHNGQAFAGVTPVSKSSRHIPYAANLTGGGGMACEFCHSPTVFTSFTTGLVSSTTMHNGTTGNGSGLCRGCHLNGLSWSAPLTTNSLNHDGTGNDCSQSGCHAPTGRTGSSYTRWN